MELEKLFLKKEELPIMGNFRKIFFQVPIHPKLLDSKIQINKLLARQVFPIVVKDWYEDLENYTPENNQEKEWINRVFLKNKLKIIKHFNHQVVNETWEEEVNLADNGFVNCFSISREGGGSLYFNKQEFNYKSYICPFINFPEEKYKEFVIEKGGNNLFIYSHKNIDTFPKALFLRNWAIMYMNEAFKEIF